MQPIGCLISGVIAAFCFAIGGVPGEIGAGVLSWIGFIAATTPLPDPWRRYKGAWVFYPPFRGPLVLIRGLEFAGLDQDELKAIAAHEIGHMTGTDRSWRFAGGVIGACTIPLLITYLLATGTPATLVSFILMLLGSVAAAIFQERVLIASERRADAMAIKVQGSDIHLLCAKLKLQALAKEQHGLYPQERGQKKEALQAKYLQDLGGLSAIPRLLLPPEEYSKAHPVGNGIVEWMTLEGEFIASLVNGTRSVKDIIDSANAQKRLTKFATIRLLHQMKEKGCIGV